MAKSKWHRNSAGWYVRDGFPDLFVRGTNQTGYCRWEVIQFRRPASYETLWRGRTLADAKRTVELEGPRWTEQALARQRRDKLADERGPLQDALQRYDNARTLLGKEDDVEGLWRCITAADALQNVVLEEAT